jgi:hypothetical protein
MTPDEVLDTPAGLLDRMMEAENVYNSFQEFESLQPGSVAKWVKMNPVKWEIVSKVNNW